MVCSSKFVEPGFAISDRDSPDETAAVGDMLAAVVPCCHGHRGFLEVSEEIDQASPCVDLGWGLACCNYSLADDEQWHVGPLGY